MKRLFLVLGLAAGLGLGAYNTASAQSVEFGPHGVRVDPGFGPGHSDVSRREAVRIARGVGMRAVDDVSRRGRRWIVEGEDRRGRDLTVEVHARTGDVLRVY